LVTDMNTLEAFHMRCQRQILHVRWCNAEVLQRSGMSTIGDVIDAYSVWPCCTPGPWVPAQWCSASDGGYLRRLKANGQLEKTAGSPSQRLVQQGSGGCQRCTVIYAVAISDRQESRSRATVHSD